jgi:serine/threonine protein phosphatase PrpC
MNLDTNSQTLVVRIRYEPLPTPSPSDEIDFRNSDEQIADPVMVQQPQKSILSLVRTLISGTKAKQGEASSPPTPPAAGAASLASKANEAISSDSASTTTSNDVAQQGVQSKRRRKGKRAKRNGVQKPFGEGVEVLGQEVDVPQDEQQQEKQEAVAKGANITQHNTDLEFRRIFSTCQRLHGQAIIGHDGAEGREFDPRVHHALFKASSKGKGEDAWLIRPENEWLLNNDLDAGTGTCSSNFGVWGIFDGHGGRQVATFASNALIKELATLVQDPLPAENRLELSKVKELLGSHVNDSESETSTGSWAAQTELICRLPFALHESFERCDQEARRRYAKSGGGSTATVAMAVGWELLIANVGDSLAYLDTGSEVLSLCVTHRLQDNAAEVKRIEESGGEVACSTVDGKPAGPLRVWPGGLAMGRTLGDDEAGDLVPGCPALVQVTIPHRGARLVLGSDGLWDAINAKQAIHHVRNMQAEAAAHYLGAQAIKKDHLKDDVTVIVVDFCPSENRVPDGLVALAPANTSNDKVVPWHPVVKPEFSKSEARLMQMITDHAQRRAFCRGSCYDVNDASPYMQTSEPGENVVSQSTDAPAGMSREGGLYEELAHMRLTPEDLAQALEKSSTSGQQGRREPGQEKHRRRKRQGKGA